MARRAARSSPHTASRSSSSRPRWSRDRRPVMWPRFRAAAARMGCSQHAQKQRRSSEVPTGSPPSTLCPLHDESGVLGVVPPQRTSSLDACRLEDFRGEVVHSRVRQVEETYCFGVFMESLLAPVCVCVCHPLAAPRWPRITEVQLRTVSVLSVALYCEVLCVCPGAWEDEKLLEQGVECVASGNSELQVPSLFQRIHRRIPEMSHQSTSKWGRTIGFA